MQFEDDIETAATLLKRAVPEMVKRKIPVDPLNYALWYGYVSGRDEALEAELRKADNYNRELVERLFYAHVLKPRLPPEAALGDAAIGILAELLERVGSSAEGTQRYGHALEKGLETLRSSSDLDVIRSTLQGLVEDTEHVRELQQGFQDKLGAAQREIETLRDKLAHSEQLARHDPLTGIGNRRHFELVLTAALASPGQTGLVVLDVDHFKRINDTYGHDGGDVVLRKVAGVLQRHACEQIEVARTGGEEFAVLLHGHEGEDEPARLADRIRREIEDLRIEVPETGSPMPVITASFGVALRQTAEDGDSLYRRADTALYAAKNGGRNRVALAD